MGSKPKKEQRDEDELFPDLPARKAATPDRKAKTERPERAEKRRDPEPEPKAKKAPAEEPAKKAEARAPESHGHVAKKILVVAAMLVAAAGVGVFAVTQLGEGPTTASTTGAKAPPISPPKLAAKPTAAGPVRLQPRDPEAAIAVAKGPPSALPAKASPAPAKSTPPAKKSLSAAELAKRSANHAAIARALEAFDAVRKVDLHGDNRLFEDYKAKQKQEAELLDQLRLLGPGAIAAMKDMILELDDASSKLLVTKALAGMKDPEALKAAGDLLGSVHDIAFQTTLVRWLPDGADSNALLASDIPSEQDPSVRAMLLREYARRTGEPDINDRNVTRTGPVDETARQVFQQAALNDPDPAVRAEVVQIIGRRGDPQDMALMAQIAQTEPNLQIRQSAIIAYALTGQDQALPALDQLAHDDTLEVRASAVLAIARVGDTCPQARDQALGILDQIAQNDSRDDIRTRAQHFAQSLRSNAAQPPQRPISAQPVPYRPRPR